MAGGVPAPADRRQHGRLPGLRRLSGAARHPARGGRLSARILLVRHPEVARRWDGRCYGGSDMGWSRAGQQAARALVDRLAAVAPAAVVHSDLRRTRPLAERLARRLGLAAIPDPRWRERCFGSWEGRSWDAIWRETGGEMDRMVSDPDQYRPGGGETTAALADRALAAWRSLPDRGTTVVVTHGGPIATLRAALGQLPPDRLAGLVPGPGQVVEMGPAPGRPPPGVPPAPRR